ncbi:hypothetical protein SDC9_84763 [bioreactor metagenome]|uniref:Uncharacterized protein n=1 Tax=bioreactor metagenome TaxID=1076179 RepID=A0A644ZB67_9ZZZZ
MYPKIAEWGIDEGEEHLEKPVGDDQGEDVGCGERGCYVVEGDEHEDHRIDELAYHRAQVVAQPKHPIFAEFLEEQEDVHIYCLADSKADQGSKAHAHAHAENLLVLLLKLPAWVWSDLDEKAGYHEHDDQHENGVPDKECCMCMALYFTDDIGDQKENRHEENTYRYSYAKEADDLAADGVYDNHAGNIKREKEEFLFIHSC